MADNTLAQDVENLKGFQTDIMREVQSQAAQLGSRRTRLTKGQINKVTNQITNEIIFQSTNGWAFLASPQTLLSSSLGSGSGTISVASYVPSDTVIVQLEVVVKSNGSMKVRPDSTYGWMTAAGQTDNLTMVMFVQLSGTKTFDYSFTGSASTTSIKLTSYVRKVSGTGGGSTTVVGATTLAALTDVNLGSLSDEDNLSYSASGGKWINRGVSYSRYFMFGG